MLTIINHLSAFWTVVVMNCVQPVNWEQCLPVHEWLLPELQQGIKMYFDKEKTFLYKSEREYLTK
tara:strand:+ start:7732 stop:7926 length:195 start_codon:yes stop_codon:yes gene_type:complete